MELTRVGDTRWMSATGRTFEIASITARSGAEAAAVDAALRPPLVTAAGALSSATWN